MRERRRIRVYRIGDRAQAGTRIAFRRRLRLSVSNRRSRSSRNLVETQRRLIRECIESEIALKPEPTPAKLNLGRRVYRIGDRAQAGTVWPRSSVAGWSVSNRRSRSSRNRLEGRQHAEFECIESEIALKPEQCHRSSDSRARVYRIGDRAQAGMNREWLSRGCPQASCSELALCPLKGDDSCQICAVEHSQSASKTFWL